MKEIKIDDAFVGEIILSYVEVGENMLVEALEEKDYSNARKIVCSWEEVYNAYSALPELVGNKILGRLKNNITKAKEDLIEVAEKEMETAISVAMFALNKMEPMGLQIREVLSAQMKGFPEEIVESVIGQHVRTCEKELRKEALRFFDVFQTSLIMCGHNKTINHRWGCDGTDHALNIDIIPYENGRAIDIWNQSARVIGKCDGTCRAAKKKGFFSIRGGSTVNCDRCYDVRCNRNLTPDRLLFPKDADADEDGMIYTCSESAGDRVRRSMLDW